MKYLCMIALLGLLLTAQFLPAQAPDTLWTRWYAVCGEGNSAIETADKGYVIVGSSYGNASVYILKTNSMGDSLWSKTIGDTNYSVGFSVRQTPDNGFIIAGETTSNGSKDVWLIRTNEFGDTIWTKTFGGSHDDVGRCVQVTPDSGFILVATTSSYGSGYDDIWLIKTDQNGDTLWTKTYGGIGSDLGMFVQCTSDTGYIITGATGWEDICLIKTDLNGNAMWTKTYDLNPTQEFGTGVLESTDGYLISASGRDGIIIKTNLSGDTLWTKRILTGDESIYNDCFSITLTTEGNYLVGGNTSYGGLEPWTEGWIMLVDDNFNLIWQKVLCGSLFGGGINSAFQASDSGFVAAGSSGGGWGMGVIFLAKVAPYVTVLQKTDNNIIHSFSLSPNYPNPFNPVTTIEFSLPIFSDVTLKIFNILGEEVATLLSASLLSGSYKYEWDASSLASGVYLYRLEAGNFSEIRKMILIK